MNPFQRTLIACSAAVGDVLERPECRADATRYAMVGAFVLLTACFAFVSGTFALYTGFRSLPLAVAIGALWAVMIFTIDRYVVSGIRRVDLEGANLLQRMQQRVGELVGVAPRLALAAVISVVVATPLELRFFAREIDAEIRRAQNAQLQGATTAVDALFPEIEELKADNRRREIETVAKREAYDSIYDLAVREHAGKGLTTNSGPGSVYKDLMNRAAHALQVWQSVERTNNAAVAKNNAAIEELVRQRTERLTVDARTIAASDGFLARYSALGQLAKRDPDIHTAKWFMTLLFLVLELTPVMMKMMLKRGPYDEILDTIEHIVRVKHMQARSDLNDDVHTAVTIHSMKNVELMALQERLTRESYDYDTVGTVAAVELQDAQRQLAKAAIQDWLRNQMRVFGAPRAPRVPIRTP